MVVKNGISSAEVMWEWVNFCGERTVHSAIPNALGYVVICYHTAESTPQAWCLGVDVPGFLHSVLTAAVICSHHQHYGGNGDQDREVGHVSWQVCNMGWECENAQQRM